MAEEKAEKDFGGEMTGEKAATILAAIYEKALDGVPKVSRSIDDFADDYMSVSTIICPDSQSVWDTFTTGKSPASRFRYDDRISACRSL